MKKLYEKSKLGFALAWISAYCVLASLADNLSLSVGIEKLFTLPTLIILSAVALIFIKSSGALSKYGLCPPAVAPARMLYYAPLIILLTVNLWWGFDMNLSLPETALYIPSMLFVGFLEEIIFRGFLLDAMLKSNPKSAVAVSSITFGIGHIINLINGSGAELLPNLLQVVYAVAAGFMFVMIYCKSKSLVPCIITHGVFNALSVFSAQTGTFEQIISAVAITAISASYAIYLTALPDVPHTADSDTESD